MTSGTDKPILRQHEVLDKLRVSRATLANWRRAGGFPAPIKLGPRLLGWHKSDVDEWLKADRGG